MPPLTHFTPAERQQVLDTLLAGLQADPRIAGVLIVGSGAEGFIDAHSDIDLAVVLHARAQVEPAFLDWDARLHTEFPVAIRQIVPRGSHIWLDVILLETMLEIDMSFQAVEDLTARRARWRVAFDHTDRLADLMQTSWAARPTPDHAAITERYLTGTWHYIRKVAVGAQRGRLWQALYDLELVRARAVELAGLRHGINTQHFRDVHLLPEEFPAALAETLVAQPDRDAILRALRAVTVLFFAELRAAEAQTGGDRAASLEALLLAYLDQLA
jgi:predicted nucleotidyltransferase